MTARPRDPTRTAEVRRRWRLGRNRIDYSPSGEAMALIEGRREPHPPLNTLGRTIDAIVLEWAVLTGRRLPPVPARPERTGGDNVSDWIQKRIAELHAAARAKASKWGEKPELALDSASLRVTCGAKRATDGKPCEALSVPGKRRCKWHGGKSTGPKTPAGKARCAANLPNRKVAPHDPE